MKNHQQLVEKPLRDRLDLAGTVKCHSWKIFKMPIQTSSRFTTLFTVPVTSWFDMLFFVGHTRADFHIPEILVIFDDIKRFWPNGFVPFLRMAMHGNFPFPSLQPASFGETHDRPAAVNG